MNYWFFYFFFFKHKTAYEMRISDWSLDVCSSDLGAMDQACGPPGSGSGHAEYRHHRPVDRTGGFLVMERVLEGLVPAYLLLCLSLGGASAAGLWANMLLQLLAIPIILWSLLSRPATPLSPPARPLLLLAWLAVALVAVQPIPLPPFLWTLFPGRGAIVDG